MASVPVLEIRGLRVHYRRPHGPPVVALDGLDLDLAAGQVLGILGESGCGKSTLARAVLGLLPRSATVEGGRIRLRGRDLRELGEGELQRLRGAEVSLVFQEPAQALHPTRRVGEQVAEVFRAHRPWPRRRRRAEARRQLEAVGLPGAFSAYPHQLSGGQRQRVVLAQALACEPALVIADEPTASLDTTTANQVLALFHDLRQRLDTAFLFISHKPQVLAAVADRVLVMHRGKRVEEGPRGQVLERPEHPYTRSLLACLPPAPPAVPSPDAPPPTPLVRAEALGKRYRRGAASGGRKTIVALDGVSFEVAAGATVAVVGESGGGKSTLARCLALLEEPTSGEVWVDGMATSGLGARDKRVLRPQLQLIFQDPASALSPRLTAVQAVAEPLRVKGVKRAERRGRALDLMSEVGLSPDLADRLPRQLSGGQKQRLVIARALAAEPRLLILDEGLTGLDLPLQAQITRLLADLQERRGLAYVVVSHDLRLVAHLADRVAVINDGRLVEEGAPHEVLSRPRHPKTRALLAPPAERPSTPT